MVRLLFLPQGLHTIPTLSERSTDILWASIEKILTPIKFTSNRQDTLGAITIKCNERLPLNA